MSICHFFQQGLKITDISFFFFFLSFVETCKCCINTYTLYQSIQTNKIRPLKQVSVQIQHFIVVSLKYEHTISIKKKHEATITLHYREFNLIWSSPRNHVGEERYVIYFFLFKDLVGCLSFFVLFFIFSNKFVPTHSSMEKVWALAMHRRASLPFRR